MLWVLIVKRLENETIHFGEIEVLRKCMRGSRGRGRESGSPPPLKNHKAIGFLSNSGS